jgi:adenylate kinase family enzyme
MKIYIVGPVASGKSTLAKRLAETLNIPYQPLDEVVHVPDKSHPWGNRKRPVEERDKLFQWVIQQSNWVIEDVGRPFFEEGLVEADTIVLLDISVKIRNYRIIKRWIKQRLGIEKCIYNPDYKMLKSMFKWSKDYDTGKDNLRERIAIYQKKVVTLRNSKDIDEFLNQCIYIIKPKIGEHYA